MAAKTNHNRSKTSLIVVAKRLRTQVRSRSKFSAAILIVIVLILGGYFILRSHASGVSTSKETELGTISGNAKTSNDSTASGSASVQFGNNQKPLNKARLGVDINTLPSGMSLATAYNEIASLGFGWVRASTYVSNYTDLTVSDSDLREAKRTNTKVLMTVTYAYGSTGCSSGHCAPKDPAAWAKYVGQLVRHWNQTYPGVVLAVEIWNEANNPNFWNPVSPSKYADLLKRSYLEIKAASPTMTVVVSGTAPGGGNQSADNTSNPNNPATFYKQIYAAGVKGSFDAAANHPYDTSNMTTNSTLSGLRNTFWIRKVMNSNSDNLKQIWSTEAGLNSCFALGNGNTPMTEHQRATRLSADLNDFWYGVHSATDGHSIGTSTHDDWGAGPYFVYKLYKAGNAGSDPGFGVVYNTKSYMKNSINTSEPLCKNPPNDYYEPEIANVIRLFSATQQ